MRPLEIPGLPTLRGEAAICALLGFIHELEVEKGKELTEKQTAALIKIAKGLISSIEVEMRFSTSDKDIKGIRSMRQLGKSIMKCLPECVRPPFF